MTSLFFLCLVVMMVAEVQASWIGRLFGVDKIGQNAGQSLRQGADSLSEAIKLLEGGRNFGEKFGKDLVEAARELRAGLAAFKLLDSETNKNLASIDKTIKELPEAMRKELETFVETAVPSFFSRLYFLVVLVGVVALFVIRYHKASFVEILLVASLIVLGYSIAWTAVDSFQQNQDIYQLQIDTLKVQMLLASTRSDAGDIRFKPLSDPSCKLLRVGNRPDNPLPSPKVQHFEIDPRCFDKQTMRPFALVLKIVQHNDNSPLSSTAGHNYMDISVVQKGMSEPVFVRYHEFHYYSENPYELTIPWNPSGAHAITIDFIALHITGTHGAYGNMNWYDISVGAIWVKE